MIDPNEQADGHILDQPIWGALSSHHAMLAQGDALAKRCPGAILPFAGLPVQDGEHWSALLGLAKLDLPCILIQAQHRHINN